jgi:hypothetical protein
MCVSHIFLGCLAQLELWQTPVPVSLARNVNKVNPDEINYCEHTLNFVGGKDNKTTSVCTRGDIESPNYIFIGCCDRQLESKLESE